MRAIAASTWRSCARATIGPMRLFIVLLSALFALAACHREGPAEKAGRKLDQAGRDLRDAVKGDK